mmetsp:Transcript_12755/g.13886  ORF Transcript_12755/g.13886 Transcript_12755/m.13886 type:complete len:147 (-) Transcript_12755:26-466(-)
MASVLTVLKEETCFLGTWTFATFGPSAGTAKTTVAACCVDLGLIFISIEAIFLVLQTSKHKAVKEEWSAFHRWESLARLSKTFLAASLSFSSNERKGKDCKTSSFTLRRSPALEISATVMMGSWDPAGATTSGACEFLRRLSLSTA